MTKWMAVEVRFEGQTSVDKGTIVAGCLYCGADVDYLRICPDGIEVPIRCPCGGELAFRRDGNERGSVRRPYGCAEWSAIESTNLAAAGRIGSKWVVVAFRGGGVYAYAAEGRARELYADLRASKSAGRFLHRVLKKLETRRLCARWGCFGSPNRERNQVLCDDCLADRPHRR
jgi:hypothetical protein